MLIITVSVQVSRKMNYAVICVCIVSTVVMDHIYAHIFRHNNAGMMQARYVVANSFLNPELFCCI